MAQPTVETSDKFVDWRTKTNTISSNVGDPDSIDLTPIGAGAQTNTVAAINLVAQATIDNSLVYAIALG